MSADGPDANHTAHTAGNGVGHLPRGGKTWVVTLRLPEDWEPLVMKLIASPDTPYKTYADVIRHGVVGVLEMWGDELERSKLAALYASERIVRTVLEEEEGYRRLEENIETLRAQVQRLKDEGEQDRADQIMATFLRAVMKLPDDFWRRRYLAAFGQVQDGQDDK